MAQKRVGRPRTDPDIVDAVEELARQGWSGPKIETKISSDERYRERAPSLKTVQNLMRAARMPEIVTDADAWAVATAPAGEAEHVLRVLGCVIDQTAGRVSRLRRDHAAWVARIAAAIPHVSAWNVYVQAGEYVKAVERGESAEMLDRRLARLAWKPTAEAEEAKGEAFARGVLASVSPTRAAMRGMVRVPVGEVVDDNMRLLIEQARRDLEELGND